MKPIKLEFFGLFNFNENQTVDFGAFAGADRVYLSGGASVLADLLLYALFGRSDRGKTERFVINKKTGRAGVGLLFEHGGERYLIEREFGIIRGGKFASSDAVLNAVRGGVNYLKAEGADAVDAQIEGILGADAAAYKKAVSADVCRVLKLLSRTDEAQSRFFKDYFGIRDFSARFEKRVSGSLAELKIKKTALGAKGAAADAGALRSEKDGLNKKLAELTERREFIADRVAKAGEIISMRERLTALNAEIDALDAEKKDYDELEKKIRDSERAAKILPAYKRRETLISENAELAAQREELIAKAAYLDAEAEAARLDEERADREYAVVFAEYGEKRAELKRNLSRGADSGGVDSDNSAYVRGNGGVADFGGTATAYPEINSVENSVENGDENLRAGSVEIGVENSREASDGTACAVENADGNFAGNGGGNAGEYACADGNGVETLNGSGDGNFGNTAGNADENVYAKITLTDGEFGTILARKRDLIKRRDETAAECDAIKKKINELTVDPALSFDMSKANSEEGLLKRLLKERRYLEKKADELDDKINAAALRRERASERILELEERANDLSREKLRLIGDNDIYDVFTREYLRYNDLAHQVGKVDTYNDAIKLLTKKRQMNKEEIERGERELDRAEATKRNAEKNLYNVNAKTDIAQKEREKVSNANYFAGISNAVRIGDFCPICSNVTTYKQSKTVLSVVPVDMELNKLRDDRTRAEEILANAAAIIAGLKANILHMKRLNQDLDRDERFYIDCISDILREGGFDSVQSLYEVYMLQREKYDRLRGVFERAGKILSEIDELKDAMRDAEIEKANADKEVAVYSEQYNERKYALELVDVEYAKSLESYTSLNSLSEYDTPERILKHIEEMSSERLSYEKELEKKSGERDGLERLIAECGRLEALSLDGTGGTAYFANAAVSERLGCDVAGVLEYEERVSLARAATEEAREKVQSAEKELQTVSNELAGLSRVIEANEKQIAGLTADYINDGGKDAEEYGAEELESLIMGGFLYENSVLRLDEYKIKFGALSEERDNLASLIDGAEAETDAVSERESEELRAIDEEINEVKNRILFVEYAEKTADGDGVLTDADGGEIDAKINALLELREFVAADGAYADYVTEMNARGALDAADAIVNGALNGRFGLTYDDGIRVKDKLFNDKFRTIGTLGEGERLIIAAAIAAALADAAIKGGSDVLFIEGFEAFGAERLVEFKAVAEKIGKGRAFLGVPVKERAENGAAEIKTAAVENGYVLA
ncbi:MAG: hypothetical protein LBP79_07025 [Clostridiales bacterium]|jgi:hypothetical protein|nr:hypothetical protein [Clostridiales bacterium]